MDGASRPGLSRRAQTFPTRKESIPIQNSGDIELLVLTHQVKTLGDWPVACGGFSDIFLGEWEREKPNGRLNVAIKILRVTEGGGFNNKRAKKRLNREVYLMHDLHHPNIAELYGVTYHMGDRPGMVIRWYTNGNSSDYLSKHPEVDRTEIIKDVAEGLHYLHTLHKPIVHGDLKSSNVLIDDDGRAILTDFGLSRIIEECYQPSGYTTANIAFGGSFRWGAPELTTLDTNDESESPRPTRASDIWSFGCTVYEIVTGHLPYYRCVHDWAVLRCLIQKQRPADDDDSFKDPNSMIHTLLRDCWEWEPRRRPEIEKIRNRLRQS